MKRITSTTRFYNAFETIVLNEKRSLYMRLEEWKKDVKIKIQYPEPGSKMTHPYFYVESRFGLVPWIPTQVELFSNNWVVYEED